jgi:hypothetical protein
MLMTAFPIYDAVIMKVTSDSLLVIKVQSLVIASWSLQI